MSRKKSGDDDKVADIEQARKKKQEQQQPGETLNDKLATKLASMNERFGVMDELGKVVVWATQPDGEGRWSIYAEKDFKLKMAKELVLVASKKEGDVKLVNPTGPWFNWPDRREFSGSGMWPLGEEPAGKLNLWRGFAIERKPGQWDTIKDFLLNVICCGRQEEYDYLLDLIAWKLQNPFAAPEVALALRGETGVGKGTLSRILRRIFGTTFKAVSSSEHVLGRHNDMLLGATVMFLDEAFFAGDPKQVDQFKAFVTEPKLTIRPMYRAAFETTNSIFWLIATNHDKVVDAMAGDRRHFVLEPSDARQGDREYFKALHAAIEGEELQAFLDELLAFDLSDWHPRESVPQTDALHKQKQMSVKGVAAWVAELLANESLEAARITKGIVSGAEAEDGWPDSEQHLEIGPAFEAYCDWHVRKRQSGPVLPRKAFEMAMNKWLPLSTRERGKDSPQGRRYWIVPLHPLCSAHFEGVLRGKTMGRR